MTGQSQRLMTRAWVEIDLGALVRNAERFGDAARAPLLPMVKADAYGLGAVRVARALMQLGRPPWGFGVATIEEGEQLRQSGIDVPILVVSPILSADFDAARRSELRPVLGDPATIEQWTRIGGPWHLMIDTGMSRAGVPWREVGTIAEAARRHPPEGICTHFVSSQLPDGSREMQEGRFADAVASLAFPNVLLHADNSGAVEHRAPTPFHLVRPGIFLYGVSSGHAPIFEPEPVVAVRARVVEVRVVKAGDTVSYDASWKAPRAGRIATLSLGYADGYRRALGNRAEALLRGKRVSVVGFVTMDMTMLDVTDHPCNPGDVITLIGRDGDATLTVSDVAAAGGLSPYELLTGLRGRLPRSYLG
jgi:alanine racemase